MSAEAVEAAVPNLNLTPEEKRIYGLLFRQADTDNVGVVTGDVAVKFFEKTRLDSSVLGEIWQIADHENRGFLTPAGFGIVLRLIGHAQAGRHPTRELAFQQAPAPRFDGIVLPGPPSAPPHPPAQPLQAQGTGGVAIRIPPLTPEKVSQYSTLFERQSLQGGNMLPGDQARTIFEKSGLPNEILGRIWQLADTEQRGALVQTEFVIAMHLLTSMKAGTLRGLPHVLPAALYEAATRRIPAPRQSPQTTGQVASAIPRQLSGSAHMRPMPRSPLGPQPTGGLAPQVTGPIQPQMTGSNDWLVTPADKARFDQFYNDLDKTNKGFITGEEAVPFLSQSNLSEDALAQVWDLSDINSEGRLTRDTFAVAMYLIRQQRSRRDGGGLPAALPPNLIPPSMRAQAPGPAMGGSPFDAPGPAPVPAPAPVQAPPPPKSALDDLFGLDSPTPPPVQVPQATGGSAAQDPFAGASPIAPASPARASPNVGAFNKPFGSSPAFVPSSTFGSKLMTAQDTGGSNSSAAKPASMSAGMDDLLGDADPEISSKLNNDSTELANLSNQVSSLSNKMQQVQVDRTKTQKDITQTNQQKKNFEDRLTQLRALYEKEAKDLAELKDQLEQSRAEMRNIMSESATIDASYQDLLAQHQQITAALQADQQENASLKQKISAVNAEVAQLKPQIEKLKSDARQQKGMVAINKKQLSTVEGERDKLKNEADELAKGHEDVSRQANTSSPVAVPPAQVASPAPSTSSANNPFFKRTGSTDMMGAFASPPIAKPYGGDKSFDDIFGGFAPSSSSTPPPPTSFKQQNTGTSTASVGSFATPGTSTLTTSPPVSRAGEMTAPAPLVTPNPLEPTATGQSAVSAADSARGPAAAPAGDNAFPSRNGSIPGAFPEEPVKPAESSPFAGNRDSEIFETMKKEPLSAKDDFDSAFASFKGSKSEEEAKDTSNPVAKFDSEFPPISELNHDDESDSASEENGFDDDFTPVSPGTKKDKSSGTPKAPLSPTAAKSAAAPDVPAAEGASTATAAEPSNDVNSAAGPKHDDPFAPASDFAPAPGTVTNTAPPAPKGAFDDLDDEFEGLEDAKEGSADDEFANISRPNMDDFNSVFDCSPPPSQPKSDSAHAFGTESSYDFGNVSTTSAGAPTARAAPGSSSGPKAPDNHDWDSIFATLDEPQAGDGSVPAAKGADDAKSPGSPSSTLAPPRPEAPGRALTEEGTHDDPILKNLTGMGYSRTDSLNALEKYDYNLERAANYLASQS